LNTDKVQKQWYEGKFPTLPLPQKYGKRNSVMTEGKQKLLHKNRESVEKVTGKVIPVHIMKTYRGSGGILPLILNLSIR
jgi:hypothetical protein